MLILPRASNDTKWLVGDVPSQRPTELAGGEMPRHLRAGIVPALGIVIAGWAGGLRGGVAGDERAVGCAEQLIDMVAEVAEPREYGAEQHVADLLAAAE